MRLMKEFYTTYPVRLLFFSPSLSRLTIVDFWMEQVRDVAESRLNLYLSNLLLRRVYASLCSTPVSPIFSPLFPSSHSSADLGLLIGHATSSSLNGMELKEAFAMYFLEIKRNNLIENRKLLLGLTASSFALKCLTVIRRDCNRYRLRRGCERNECISTCGTRLSREK